MSAGLRKIMTMKLFGTALLSLTLFSSCCADAENPLAQSPSNASTITEPPNGVSTTLPADNRSSVVTPNMIGTNDSRSTVTPPTNLRFQSPPNNINSNITGSPGQDSMASMSNSTSVDTSGKNNTTTTKSDIPKYTTEPLQVNSSEGEHINSTGDTNQQTKTASSHADTNASGGKDDSPYSGIILPVVIALIVISLIVFLLMALYKICLKTTPERQENGTEQNPLDKENVKLISVKTTSPEIGMSSFWTLSSYDLPLDMSLPLEAFKPMRAVFSREE